LTTLRAAWFIARSDVAYLLRQRETLLWTFLMPPAFFFFIGSVTGGFGGSGDVAPSITVQTARDAGFLADHVVRRIEEQGFDVTRSSDLDTLPVARRRLILPAGFTDSVAVKKPVKVEFATQSDVGIDSQYDQIRVARAVYGVLSVSQAGSRAEFPTGFEQSVPGTMVMFTLLVMLTSGSVLLVIERNQGLLRRLASSPLPRRGVVLGKWGGRLFLGLVQISFAMLVGTLLFKIRWGPDLPMLLVILLAWGALAAVLGILLGNLARTEGQSIAIGVLASNILAALGGCWWPIEVTPQWMQSFALTLPTGWTMDALHRLVSFGAGATSAAPHLLALVVATLVLASAAVRTFRFQ
jgi:ABC-type multidrug transport system permease subunit